MTGGRSRPPRELQPHHDPVLNVPCHKKIAFLAPRPDLSREAFLRYWREVHGPVVSGAPGYARWRSRYVQNHVVADGPFGRGLGHAGMAEFWLPGANEDEYALSSTYRDHIQPDERRFIDMDGTVSMTALEHVVLPGHGPTKLVVLARRASGQDPAAFARTATGHAAAGAPSLAGLAEGYALNLVVPGSFRLPGARPAESLAIDAVHELWFSSPKILADAARDSGLRQTLALDDHHAPGDVVSFVARELVFFDKGRPVRPEEGGVSPAA